MTTETKNHINSLDGLRAMAALMVMVFHFFQHIKTDDSILILFIKLTGFGQTGVSLFFVLSGFLITRILIKEKQSENYFLNFYIRRSLRIFPLYYFYLVLVYFIIPIIQNTSIPAFSQQIYHWIYIQDFALTFNWTHSGPLHFWSLAVEEHFYLFFPLLVYFLRLKHLIIALSCLITLSIILRFIMTSYGYEVFYFTFTRLDELCIGAFLAVLEVRGKLLSNYAKYYYTLFVLSVIPVCVLWYIYSSQSNLYIQTFKYILIAIVYFSVIGIIITATKRNLLVKILSIRPLLFTGKISYGLYVYHGICFILFSRYFSTNNIFTNFFGSFLLSFGVATLSFYSFEKWFLKLKKYFNYNRV